MALLGILTFIRQQTCKSISKIIIQYLNLLIPLFSTGHQPLVLNCVNIWWQRLPSAWTYSNERIWSTFARKHTFGLMAASLDSVIMWRTGVFIWVDEFVGWCQARPLQNQWNDFWCWSKQEDSQTSRFEWGVYWSCKLIWITVDGYIAVRLMT